MDSYRNYDKISDNKLSNLLIKVAQDVDSKLQSNHLYEGSRDYMQNMINNSVGNFIKQSISPNYLSSMKYYDGYLKNGIYYDTISVGNKSEHAVAVEIIVNKPGKNKITILDSDKRHFIESYQSSAANILYKSYGFSKDNTEFQYKFSRQQDSKNCVINAFCTNTYCILNNKTFNSLSNNDLSLINQSAIKFAPLIRYIANCNENGKQIIASIFQNTISNLFLMQTIPETSSKSTKSNVLVIANKPVNKPMQYMPAVQNLKIEDNYKSIYNPQRKINYIKNNILRVSNTKNSKPSNTYRISSQTYQKLNGKKFSQR